MLPKADEFADENPLTPVQCHALTGSSIRDLEDSVTRRVNLEEAIAQLIKLLRD